MYLFIFFNQFFIHTDIYIYDDHDYISEIKKINY